jgi:hypothetical protein
MAANYIKGRVGRGFVLAIALGCALALPLSVHAGQPVAPEQEKSPKFSVERVCELIANNADANGVPRDFLARLIWKESRFDPNAVSPVGAEGIAQFMPGTASLRGLADPFDIEQAIPASAKYLGELKAGYGNLGLAAAAYNAGEKRVSRWLASGGNLPLETENYVLEIMGEPAASFSNRAYAGTVHPLDPKREFRDACRKLPVVRTAAAPRKLGTAAMAPRAMPWGVQIAGNARREAAVQQYERVRRQFSKFLAGQQPSVSRVRGARGRIYAVRIGADSRSAAEAMCAKLRNAGGACVVMKNGL